MSAFERGAQPLPVGSAAPGARPTAVPRVGRRGEHRFVDLAVVGGGPGGLACALAAARRGLRVAVFEPALGARDKPCGEGLMPAALDVLEALGLSELVGRARPFGAIRYAVDGCAPLEIPLPRAGASIERPTLVAALEAGLSRVGGVARIDHRAEVLRSGPGDFRIEAGGDVFLARTVVAADGLGGRACDWLRHAASSPGRRVGLRARATAAEPLDAVEVHLGRGAELYLTPLAGGGVNVVALIDEESGTTRAGRGNGRRRSVDGRGAVDAEVGRASGGARGLLDHVRALYPAGSARLGELSTQPVARRLALRPAARVASEGAFLVGDAAGGVDPVVGCGTTIALASGLEAARLAAALVDGAPARSVERRYRAFWRREALGPRALAAYLRAVGRHPALARASVATLRALPQVSRGLVGLVAGGSVGDGSGSGGSGAEGSGAEGSGAAGPRR